MAKTRAVPNDDKLKGRVHCYSGTRGSNGLDASDATTVAGDCEGVTDVEIEIDCQGNKTVVTGRK